MDISLDHVTEVLSGYTIGSNGYVWLVSSDGMLIYHPNAELVQQNIADVNVSDNVVNAIMNQSTEFLKYKADGTTKYGSVQLVGETGYLVFSNMPFLEYYQMLFATIGVLLVIFAVGIIVVMAQYRQERICAVETDRGIERDGKQAGRGRSGCRAERHGKE